MSWNYSSGAKKALLDTGSYKSVFAAGFIEIYEGTRPGDVESAPTGTKLVTITNNGGAFTPGDITNGLNLELSGENLVIATGENWTGTAVASGTAGWARFYENAASPTVWKDGIVTTTTGGDLVMSGGRNISNGGSVTIISATIGAKGTD